MVAILVFCLEEVLVVWEMHAGEGELKKIIKQCLDIKKSVFLPTEINRGTVRFRRPQFGDDPLESQPVDFFFYFCIAVMQYWITSPVRLIPTIIFTVPSPAKS